MTAKTKTVIVLAIWFACLITSIQFFRFKFGLFKISAVFLLVGIPLMLLFTRPSKPN